MKQIIRYAAIAGNTLFFLWILYNGVNEGFNARPLEKFVLTSLLLLLVLNIGLLATGHD